MKLSNAQKAALSLLPVQITTWGGKPFCGMPSGIKSRATLHALLAKKLAIVRFVGTQEVWTLTAEGKKALEDAA